MRKREVVGRRIVDVVRYRVTAAQAREHGYPPLEGVVELVLDDGSVIAGLTNETDYDYIVTLHRYPKQRQVWKVE